MATLGQELREERERRAISIKNIADQTKINSRLLQALENDRWDEIPGSFFLKGVLKAHVRSIGADPEVFLKKYEDQREKKAAAAGIKSGGPVTISRPKTSSPENAGKPAFPSGLRLPRRARLLIFAVIIITLAASLVVFRIIRRTGPEEIPITERPPGSSPVAALLPPAVAEEAQEKPASAPSVLRLEFRFRADSWMHVSADDLVVLEGTRPAGTTASLEAEREFIIQTGNAGGFDMILNGRAARSLGGPGVVRTDIRINASNLETFLKKEESPADPRVFRP